MEIVDIAEEEDGGEKTNPDAQMSQQRNKTERTTIDGCCIRHVQLVIAVNRITDDFFVPFK